MDEQDEFVKYVAGGIFRYGHAQRSSDVILWFAASGAFCIGSNDRFAGNLEFFGLLTVR